MQTDPKISPPLNLLKAFDAAGRHSSFVLAAVELGVSPAAVSQLVRKLESQLGKELFLRFNNRIALTDAGRALFAATSPALTELSETMQRFSRKSDRRKLKINVISSLAECWLLFVLPRFLESNPNIRIDLSIEEEAAIGTYDIRLGYGRQMDSELVQEELFRDEVVPYCSPEFLRNHEAARVFTASSSPFLIHTQWGTSFASNATWRDWFHVFEPGVRIDVGQGHDVNTSRAALQLAEHGVGVALGQKLLAREAVANNRLVEVSPHSLPLGQSYTIAVPLAHTRRVDVQVFRAWLLSEVSTPS